MIKDVTPTRIHMPGYDRKMTVAELEDQYERRNAQIKSLLEAVQPLTLREWDGMTFEEVAPLLAVRCKQAIERINFYAAECLKLTEELKDAQKEALTARTAIRLITEERAAALSSKPLAETIDDDDVGHYSACTGNVSKIEGARSDWKPERAEVGFELQGEAADDV